MAMQMTVFHGKNNPIAIEGEHTLISAIARNGWNISPKILGVRRTMPLATIRAMESWSAALKENGGLPHNILNYGAHGRTHALASMLKDSVILENGRCSIVLGTYVFEQGGQPFDVPLVGVSTGMGISSEEIIVKEICAYVSNDILYIFNGKEMPAGPINMIRVGTCGGCNFEMGSHLAEPVVDRPALVNAVNNLVSLYSPLIETSPLPPQFVLDQDSDFARFWREERKTHVVQVGNWAFLKNQNSPEVVQAIQAAAQTNGLLCHLGNSLSKASLSLESAHPELLKMLRAYQNVIASEMEQGGNANLSVYFAKEYGIRAMTGMVALIVGALPGSGFPEPGNMQHEKEVATGMRNALFVGLEALASLAFNEKKGP